MRLISWFIRIRWPQHWTRHWLRGPALINYYAREEMIPILTEQLYAPNPLFQRIKES